MNEQQINIAIAEAVGWKRTVQPDDEGAPTSYWIHPEKSGWFHDLPNFCGDLNAVAQAEATLTDEQWGQYRQHLFTEAAGKDCKDFATRLAPKLPPRFTRGRAYASATALQRATAFVRALNLEPKSK